jgi:hypothetical protein
MNPGKLNPAAENKIYLRSLVVKNDAVLELRVDVVLTGDAGREATGEKRGAVVSAAPSTG